ncbi:hypothetical protein HK414_04735 [Ramlibacter terrae]|uniref:Uncharacterized protein n=1 Tax=Ramlibacter terrae TaxID=2732511 RepID=A0ABX6NZD1_9BURK|nr:hypothetical protein HK414_04735 [Ramlibacter terrae]
MNDANDNKALAPGEARGDGKALHGARTEVNWDGGRGAQPYANPGRRGAGAGDGG